MFKTLAIAAALIFSSVSAFAASSEAVRQFHTTAQLHSAYDAVDGQSSFPVLFHLNIDQDWHTYWKNPGDSGIATNLEWTLPEGWSASPIIWQAPSRLPYGPLMNYGYDHDAYHLVEITPAAGSDAGEVILKAKANWLVCKEECIPESADVEITVTVGGAAIASSQRDQIAALQASAALPENHGVFSTGADKKSVLRFAADELGEGKITDAYFFTDESATVEPAEPQPFVRTGDGGLELTLTGGFIAMPKPLTGVLEVHGDAGISHRVVKAEFSETPVSVVKEGSASVPVSSGESAPQVLPDNDDALWIVLLFAVLGGVILNAMPCVFPVLSLKALGLSRKSTKERGHVRAHGISYTLGVVGSFALVGVVLIALKYSGNAIGWGYQMQSPYFVAFLAYLLTLIGLNLAGYFDLSFSMNVKTRVDGEDTLKGSFATGALVTLVATPCSAPFMATALGAALVKPPAIGLLIFIAMGFGLALPYLLLTTIPGALKWMPKPGLWMERFKQFLAFPMFISAVWLLWVFMLQAGAHATALVLLGLVLLTFALWLWRVLSPKTFTGRAVVLILLAAVATAPLSFLPESIMRPDAGAVSADHAVPYDAAALDSLRAEGKPVFVYATAAWCITCKVNERVALADASVKDFFTEQGITVMIADWTNEDPAITAFLERYGRAGVPLYVYYPAGEDAPRILPQLLTPSNVIQNLKGK